MESETIKDLLKSGVNVNVTIGINELKDFLKELINQTKEKPAIEKLLTAKETSKMLNVDASTLFRWNKKGYLKPVNFGGGVRYKLSDIENIGNNDI